MDRHVCTDCGKHISRRKDLRRHQQSRICHERTHPEMQAARIKAVQERHRQRNRDRLRHIRQCGPPNVPGERASVAQYMLMPAIENIGRNEEDDEDNFLPAIDDDLKRHRNRLHRIRQRDPPNVDQERANVAQYMPIPVIENAGRNSEEDENKFGSAIDDEAEAKGLDCIVM
jgi:hypothetical protein